MYATPGMITADLVGSCGLTWTKPLWLRGRSVVVILEPGTPRMGAEGVVNNRWQKLNVAAGIAAGGGVRIPAITSEGVQIEAVRFCVANKGGFRTLRRRYPIKYEWPPATSSAPSAPAKATRSKRHRAARRDPRLHSVLIPNCADGWSTSVEVSRSYGRLEWKWPVEAQYLMKGGWIDHTPNTNVADRTLRYCSHGKHAGKIMPLYWSKSRY